MPLNDASPWFGRGIPGMNRPVSIPGFVCRSADLESMNDAFFENLRISMKYQHFLKYRTLIRFHPTGG